MTEPTTAAGRALHDSFEDLYGDATLDNIARDILAIEAEARAAALDEARAAVDAVPWNDRDLWLAAIDALRGVRP